MAVPHTVTHTTAREPNYIGRFAPSPTGHLHFGSFISALASYLDARHHQGQWLIRVDDLDPERCHDEYTLKILKALEYFNLNWDGEIVYQSKRTDYYKDILDQLIADGMTYRCYCSRQQIPVNRPYPGTCRSIISIPNKSFSIRINVGITSQDFTDRLQGHIEQRLDLVIGDFNVQRRDGVCSYHLATVIDDAFQKINQVVRGYDLVDSTPRQIFLQKTLGYPTPEYLHIPVATNADGNKFSKQNKAPDVTLQCRNTVLKNALIFLRQELPPQVETNNYDDMLKWAVSHWDGTHIPAINKIPIAHNGALL